MPLRKGGTDEDVSFDVGELMKTGRPQKQAIAIALRVNGKARKPGVKRQKSEVRIQKK